MYRLILLIVISMLFGCSGFSASKFSSEEAAQNLSLAENSYKQGLWQEAESYYRSLLKDNPDLYQAWFRLGNIYARTGQLDAAVTMYERCLELDPDQARAWYNLSVVRARQSLRISTEAQQRFMEESPQEALRFSHFRSRLVGALTEGSEQKSQ